MTGAAALILALVLLALTLAAAVLRPRRVPESVVAVVSALILIATGAIGGSAAGDTLRSLGPTVAFLAARPGCHRAAARL